MLPPPTQALLLATLLALPLGAQLWSRGRSQPTLRSSRSRQDWAFHAAYVAATVAIGALLFRELAAMPLSSRYLIPAGLMLGGGMACLLIAPIHPLAGPVVYALLSYTFPRENTVTEALMGIGTMSWVVTLSVAATGLWSRRRFGAFVAPDGRLVWLVGMFAAWLAVAIIAAIATGRPLDPDLSSRSERYVHAIALFMVVAACRPGLRDIKLLVLSLSVALVIRQLLLTGMWLNEQNLAMLAAITAPLALAVAACRPFGMLSIPLGTAATYLAVMILFVQNRGAVLGLGASLIGMWATARARRWWLVALVLLVVTVVAVAARAGLLSRFLEIYGGGQFLGTAAERLEIWEGGLRLASDHWLFGVGPGNFTHFLAPYVDARAINNPHNSFVEVLSETGVIGLLLYVSTFVVAARELIARARESPSDWRRNLAAGLLGACAAYLVTGFFLSNPSLVWMWVLLGVAAAVEQSPVDRGRSRSGA